jgi:hemerythrin-like domain-containing protein
VNDIQREFWGKAAIGKLAEREIFGAKVTGPVGSNPSAPATRVIPFPAGGVVRSEGRSVIVRAMARRHESLIPLSHEHHDALMLAWRLRTGNLSKREPELRARHVSAFFEYRLINHMRLEEELLFPACRAVLGMEASLIDVLLSDHRELRAKAAAIKAGAHDQVDIFCVLLERHIRTEERQLFVLAEDRMKPANMTELGLQIKAQLR